MKQELIEKRNSTSKEVDNGDGTHTLSLYRHPIHYLKDGKYEDIDLTLVPTARGYEMRKANYNLIITDTPGQTRIKFTKEGEWIEFVPDELRWINDEGVISVISKFVRSSPILSGNEITWKNAFGTGIDLLYGCGYAGIYKKVIIPDFIEAPEEIRNGTNPRMKIALKYTKSKIPIRIDGVIDELIEKRNVRFENVRFDSLWEFTPPRFGDDGTMSQYASQQNEDIGNRSISKDEVTTEVPYSWLIKAIFPIFIDTDINEQIGLGTDDCEEYDDTTAYLTQEGLDIGRKYSPPYVDNFIDSGFRWQTVNIPNGSTISTAKLSLYMTYDVGTLEARVIGIDEDNTATWATDSRPSQRSKTTATVQANEADWNNWAVDSWIDIDISTIIKEIIDRPGWSANNALAVVVENTETGDIDQNITVRAYEYAGNAHGAKLDIVYGDVGIAIPVVIHHLQEQGIL